MDLRFVYVSKSEEYEERAKRDWDYVSEMAKFYQWWLRTKFKLYYAVNVDALLIEKAVLMRLRFGMSDLIKYHREKGEDIYHFFLAYFRPLWSDCSVGFFTDNVGLIQWKEYANGDNKERFLALENCARVSHLMLHEVGRQKQYDNKKFKEQIHEHWDRHLYASEEYDLYDRNFKPVGREDDFMFATMRIPEYVP